MRTLLPLTWLALSLVLAWPAAASAQPIPDPPLCPEVVDEWLAHAQEIQKLGGCGLEPGNSYLSTDRALLNGICLNGGDDATASRTGAIRDLVERCTACTAYANAATIAAVDNVLYNCGNSGDRWTTNNTAHFSWCMNVRDCKPICILFVFCHDACLDWPSLLETKIAPETAARTQAIAECKIRNPEPHSCSQCHAAQRGREKL
ncbi:hypothetical protein [Aestuariivirga sp.]|uniref:hypothetical protein n=1 Tax=Aestuariivirga sp. TaxID=2650926 RepID=UPI0039E6A600